MPDSPRLPDRKFASILLLVCVLFITIGYYIFHQPIPAEFAMALGMAIWRIFTVIFYILLAGAIGKKLGIGQSESGLSSVVLQAAMGLGIISVVTLVVGSTLGINWISLFILPLVAMIALWKPGFDWIIEFSSAISRVFRETGCFERILAVLLGLIFLSTLIISLAPPLKYDAMMYHLVLPQQYINQGSINHISWLVMSGMPQTTEMLFTLAIGWGGLPAAAVMGWAIGLLAIFGILGFFQNEDTRFSRTGWVAAACLLAGETFAASLAWAYVDWTSLLFGICTITALQSWMNTSRRNNIFLAGLFAGLSLATKYTGGILFLCCLGVVIIFAVTKRAEGKTIGQGVLYFCSASLVFPAIWLFRNFLLTGNPVYPFFMPAAEMDAVRISVYQGAATFGEWWEGLALPIRATIWGAESAEGYSVSIGPLLLSLALCNLAGKQSISPQQKNSLKVSVGIVLSGWLFWAIGNRISGYLIQTRMYYSIFPALAILAGLGWVSISDIRIRKVRFSHLIGSIILLALGFSALNSLFKVIQTDALPVISGIKSETAYLDGNLGWYAPAMRAVKTLGSSGRTLFLYEPRGLACIPACDPDEILDRWKITNSEIIEPQNAVHLWKQQGFTYILLNLSGMQYLEEGTDPHHPPEEVKALREVVKNLAIVETFGTSYQIYKLQ